MDKDTFILKHFAGQVTYTVPGFLAKNKGNVAPNLRNLIEPSILTPSESRDSMPAGSRTSVAKSGSKALASKATAAPAKKSLVVKFRDQLNQLVDTIGRTHTSYVRCVKPNEKKLRQTFDGPSVLRQLRYSGMLEYISIRQSGFGVRRDYKQFLERYKICSSTASDILGTNDGDIPICKLAVDQLFLDVGTKK